MQHADGVVDEVVEGAGTTGRRPSGPGEGAADVTVVQVYDDIWAQATRRVLDCLGLAAEAGISRGLLFHYFPTKRDLYRE